MGILTLGSLFDGSGVVLPALFCIGWYCVVILVSAGDCRFIRLRGGRSSADGARGTCPSGLPSIACGRGGYARSSVLLRPAKRTAGRRGGCGKSFRM